MVRLQSDIKRCRNRTWSHWFPNRWTMGLIGLLILSFGALGFVCGTGCVSETSQCSRFWRKMEPHKGLMETKEELNKWCRKQSMFYECLESVLLAGKNDSITLLPTNLLISKLVADDLCYEGSTSRKRYLNNAGCINRLNTDFCTLPEYLDIVTPDAAVPPSRCSLAEKTFVCIAASMVMNCGFDAGKVYRNMLKITRYSDEVCDIEASYGIPLCEDLGPKESNAKRNQHLSEIYYGLVDRIGNIPEQDFEALRAKEYGFVENSKKTDEVVSDFENTDNQVVMESERTDKVNESTKPEQILVPYTIKDPLDPANDRTIWGYGTPIVLEPDYRIGTSLYSDVTKKSDIESFKKYPIITQFYRGILFYNYSGLEYSIYWRQPEYTPADTINCEHMQPSYMRGVVFRCIFTYRDKDPDCLSDATDHEPVTPELIRDIDPDVPYDGIVDFGPRPQWMKTMDEAKEAKILRDLMSSTTTEPPQYNPTTVNPEVSTSFLHIAEAITMTPGPKWWEPKYRTVLPEDIRQELMALFMPEPEKAVPLPMIAFRAGDEYYAYIFDHNQTNYVENVTCARLNECHPRAQGLFRCHAFRRKITPCEECGKFGTSAYIEDLPATYSSITQGEPAFEVSETTDPSEMPDASGEEELRPSEELITLLFSGNEMSESKSGLESAEENQESSKSLEFINEDDSSYSATDSEVFAPEELITLIFSDSRMELAEDARSDPAEESADGIEDSKSGLGLPTVQMVVMDQNAESLQKETSDVAEILYSVNDVKRLGVQALPELTLSSDDYRLLEDVVLLQNMPDDDDGIDARYAVVDSLDDAR